MDRPIQPRLFAGPTGEIAVAGRSYMLQWLEKTWEVAARSPSGMLVAGTGLGKCLARGTPVLMYDGTTRPVEEIQVGDFLMGPDSLPRRVLSLAQGRDVMYRIIPTKGEPFTVNSSHILSLKITPARKGQKHQIINISVQDYLKKPKKFKHCAKGWRVGVEFVNKLTFIEPYFLGLWLGDGTSLNAGISTADPELIDYLKGFADRMVMDITVDRYPDKCPYVRIHSNPGRQNPGTENRLVKILERMNLLGNKHIPHDHLANDREHRLQLLAGLIDSDGSAEGGCYTFSNTNERLIDDVVYLCRSLGFAAYKAARRTKCQNGVWCDSFRVTISGDLSQVPVKLERKKLPPRRQVKDPLVFGFKIECVGRDAYYGFEIDGDRLFLLGDFTVTHNTVYAALVFREVLAGKLRDKYPWRKPACLYLVHSNELLKQAVGTLARYNPQSIVAVEQGELRAGGEADIVVAMRDSICKPSRFESMGNTRFTVGFVDECQHYPLSSRKWCLIRSAFDCFWIGATATPDRKDQITLQDSFAELIDYYPMLTGIQDGWLVRVHQRYAYADGLSLELEGRGDWTDAEIADRVGKAEPLAAIVGAARMYGCMPTKYRSSRPVFVVCPSVDAAENVSEQLNSWHKKESTGRAVTLTSRQNDRERESSDGAFRSGEARYLCVFGVGIEGYDYDEIGVCVNGRPTTVRGQIEQMAGRVVRPLEEIRTALMEAPDAATRRAIIAASRKPGALFVDLTGTQHKLTMRLATLADVFAGRSLAANPNNPKPVDPDDPFITVKRKMIEKGGMSDLSEEMLRIIEEERERMREERKAEKRAEEDRWRGVRVRANMKAIELDPFNFFDTKILPGAAIVRKGSMTEGQRRALLNMGFHPTTINGCSRKQAKQLLDMMAARKKAGLCSYRQGLKLKEFGENPNATREEATELLDRIAANGWRPLQPLEAGAA